MSWSIEIPKIDTNVTRATVVQWLVRDGDRVEAGTPLVEIETEKAVFEIEAQRAGVVRIAVHEGRRVPVGTALGVIADKGDSSAKVHTGGPVGGEISSGTVKAIDDAYVIDDYGEALLGEG